jgi:hypothetical protein
LRKRRKIYRKRCSEDIDFIKRKKERERERERERGGERLSDFLN